MPRAGRFIMVPQDTAEHTEYLVVGDDAIEDVAADIAEDYDDFFNELVSVGGDYEGYRVDSYEVIDVDEVPTHRLPNGASDYVGYSID